MSYRILALALFSVVMSACAQMVFKWGLTQGSTQEAVAAFGETYATTALVSLLLSPAVTAGFLLYALSAVVWLFVLARLDLSVAYPFVGLGFILTMFAGVALFDEPLNTPRTLGTLMVCAGVCLVARS